MGVGGEREQAGMGGKRGDVGKGGEMTQTLYVHKKKEKEINK
jgi:hypothetical protein